MWRTEIQTSLLLATDETVYSLRAGSAGKPPL